MAERVRGGRRLHRRHLPHRCSDTRRVAVLACLRRVREQGSDVDGKLAETLRNLQSDIAYIPPGTTGPFRDRLIAMYQDYVTKQRVETMSE